ncbi:MAG: hypothetical protein OEY38_22985 [Gammaproteobacteria bacterium]|nr:hypothetical protein [Gammaproteobacteria bacterium]
MPSQSLWASTPLDSLTLEKSTKESCVNNYNGQFLIAPYAAKTIDDLQGGTIEEVVEDGFSALGLSYTVGETYEQEYQRWRYTSTCLIIRLWPVRTQTDATSPLYFGEPGSLIRRGALNQYCADETNGECLEEISSADDVIIESWKNQLIAAIEHVEASIKLNSRVSAWYLGPEELSPNLTSESNLLAALAQTVKETDSQQRPIIFYNPGHLTWEQIAENGVHTDYLSMGAYPHLSGNDLQRVQVRHAMHQLQLARESLFLADSSQVKRLLPVLEMFESTDHPYSDWDAKAIPLYVRHDAYTAIANGAEGILIFSMGFRPGFDHYAAYYDAWKQVASHLNQQGFADVINQGTVLTTPQIQILEGPTTILFSNTFYFPISRRAWQHENHIYILLVNNHLRPVKIKLKNLEPSVYENIFTHSLHDGRGKTLELDLRGYETTLLVSTLGSPTINARK